MPDDEKERKDLGTKLITIREQLKTQLEQHQWTKPVSANHAAGWKPPSLVHMEGKLEVGNEKHVAHMHILVKLSAPPSHLDLKEVRAWVEASNLFPGRKIHIDAKYIPDSIQNVRQYIDKDVVEQNDIRLNRNTANDKNGFAQPTIR